MRLWCLLLILTFSGYQFAKPLEVSFSTGQNAQDSIPQDAVSRVLIRALEQIQAAELKYEFVALSRAREWQLVKQGEDLCIYNKVKTPERQKYLFYSRYPISAFPPNRLIVKRPNKLGQHLDLINVLTKTDLKIGVADGRSYGEQLDSEISLLKDRLFTLSGVDVDMRLMRMVIEGKLDGVVDFSAAFFSRKQAVGQDYAGEFSVHPLASAQKFVFGYVACVKNDLGRQVINLIDQSLAHPRVYKHMKQVFKQEFPKEESPFVLEELDSIFLK